MCHLFVRTLTAMFLFFEVRLSFSHNLHYNIDEQLPAGTQVGDIRQDLASYLNVKYSRKELDAIMFSFLQQADNIGLRVLDLDSPSGLLRTATVLDRDRLCPGSPDCTLKVDVALQPARYFEVIRVSVKVIDLNDNPPRFPSAHLRTYVSEDALPGVLIPLESAQDPDSPQFGVVQYRLVSADVDSDDVRKFRLRFERNDVDGSYDVSLVLNDTLDREIQDLYEVRVLAIDGGKPEKTGSLLVSIHVNDVNDHAPTFDNDTYELIVAENSPARKSLTRVHATDADSGRNGQITYSFSPRTLLVYGHLFSIDPDSGSISLLSPVDFEEYNLIILEVLARDGGDAAGGQSAHAAKATVRITITDMNDNRPTIKLESTEEHVSTTSAQDDGFIRIREHSQPNTFVAQVSVNDLDTGDGGRVDCYLQLPNGLNTTDFELSRLYENEYVLVTSGEMDREITANHRLVLVCHDHGSPAHYTMEDVRVFLEDINDNGPMFSERFYNFSVHENSQPLEIIAKVIAVDADEGANAEITYNLHPDTEEQFNIDKHSGAIWTTVSLDRETKDLYTLEVTASDQHHLSTVQVFIHVLDVNDEGPKFSFPSPSSTFYEFTIYENAPSRTTVGTLTAYDLDLPPYDRHTFQLESFNNSVYGSMSPFRIDSQTGVLATRQPLNREERDTYRLIAHVSDSSKPSLSRDQAVVVVHVMDVNDNWPVFTFPTPGSNTTLVLSNAAPIGHIIAHVVAHDADVGDNAELTYSFTTDHMTHVMEDGLEEEVKMRREPLFVIDPRNGTLTVEASLLEYETPTVISLRLIAQDGGMPARSSTATLSVIVSGGVAPGPSGWDAEISGAALSRTNDGELQDDTEQGSSHDGSRWAINHRISSSPTSLGVAMVAFIVFIGFISVIVVIVVCTARRCRGGASRRNKEQREDTKRRLAAEKALGIGNQNKNPVSLQPEIVQLDAGQTQVATSIDVDDSSTCCDRCGDGSDVGRTSVIGRDDDQSYVIFNRMADDVLAPCTCGPMNRAMVDNQSVAASTMFDFNGVPQYRGIGSRGFESRGLESRAGGTVGRPGVNRYSVVELVAGGPPGSPGNSLDTNCYNAQRPLYYTTDYLNDAMTARRVECLFPTVPTATSAAVTRPDWGTLPRIPRLPSWIVADNNLRSGVADSKQITNSSAQQGNCGADHSCYSGTAHSSCSGAEPSSYSCSSRAASTVTYFPNSSSVSPSTVMSSADYNNVNGCRVEPMNPFHVRSYPLSPHPVSILQTSGVRSPALCSPSRPSAQECSPRASAADEYRKRMAYNRYDGSPTLMSPRIYQQRSDLSPRSPGGRTDDSSAVG